MKFLALSLLVLLSSCSANRLQVVQSNSYTVTLQYNSVLTNYAKVSALAEQEARKYGKQAVVREVVDKRRETKFGAINTVVFDLK